MFGSWMGFHASLVADTMEYKQKQRKTKEPVIVALIGLVGSGMSSVAQELAKYIGATIISSDNIRVELRKQGEDYKQARAIAENGAIEIVKRGGNVILNSDFVDPGKRASLRDKARKASTRLVFICVYADLDIIIGRMINKPVGEFFDGASSSWTGEKKGEVVKIREMWRRTPWHYRWSKKGGGQFKIKKPPCTVIADINTTADSWKEEVKKCAKKLLEM